MDRRGILMNDSAGKSTSESVYEPPELEIHPLAAIVMSGATGGGDSGFTGFADGQPFGSDDGDKEDEEDFYSNDW